jgi:hypothetical protein
MNDADSLPPSTRLQSLRNSCGRLARSPLAQKLSLLLIPFAAFIAIVPLLRDGCSCGHDFDFHLLNWIDVAEHWRIGILYPHWMHWGAWLAGEPRFIFYPPLSWLLGGALTSLAHLHPAWLPSVAIAYSFLVMSAAGFAAYTLAHTRASRTSAILAAVLYIVNPYMLFVVYERTAYAELLAAVWFPLLLLALFAEEISIVAIAIPIALLWLSNAPAAVMGCYTVALIAIVRLISHWRATRNRSNVLHLATKYFLALLFGISLAAYYVLPAAYERRWVQIQSVIAGNLSPFNNFLFERTTDAEHDAVLYTASWVAISVLAMTAVFLLAAALKKPATRLDKNPLGPALFLTATIFILLIHISSFLYRILPNLAYLQFPWRFIAVLAAVTVLAFVLALPALRRRWLLAALLLPLVVAPIGYRIFVQSCEDDDEAALELRGIGVPTEPTDEYTPINADASQLHQVPQTFWLANITDDPPTTTPPAAVTLQHGDTENYRLTTSIATPTLLVLRLWDYPGWRVSVNGREVTNRPRRNDGLLCIPLPVGRSTVEIHFARTFDHILGQLISAIALVLLVILLRRNALARRRLSASQP